MQAGGSLKGPNKNDITAEGKPGQAATDKRFMDVEKQLAPEVNQTAKKKRLRVARGAQWIDAHESKMSTDDSDCDGSENIHTPTSRRKRGRPPRQEVQSALSNELGAPKRSERQNSDGNTGTRRKRGRPRKLRDLGHDDITDTIIPSDEREKAHKRLEASAESFDMHSKRKRGRPRAIANEVDHDIFSGSAESHAGDVRNSLPKKRKRGRPRGSKNVSSKPKVTPSPYIQGIPFDSTCNNASAASAAAEDEIEPDLLELYEMYNKYRARDFQNPPEQNWKENKFRAPNGLPGCGPDDFFFELMPLIAKMEAEENRVVSKQEKNMRRFMGKVFHQFASSHRSDPRQRNLKPFKLREDEKKGCVRCEGFGMIPCEYCEGFGFVDFGENGEKFYEEFGSHGIPLPNHVMGNMYLCPYCEGSSLKECEECSGTGSIGDRFPRNPGASRTPVNNYATEEFNLEDFLEKEKDRIDVGLDGTIILRARKRRRARNVDLQKIRDGKPKTAQNKNQPVPQERLSTPVYTSQALSPAILRLRSYLQKRGNVPFPDDPRRTTRDSRNFSSKGTDFVNTTDYKVGRSLSERKPIQFSSNESNEEDRDNASE
ncbi:hypothetical protein FGB62_47g014 [Gracilaria domingensis]|nr:hypothetical protein FGB62_47g014 [Gracilaria domingensis]